MRAATLLTLWATAALAEPPAGWSTYQNARFEYEVAHPAEWVREPEAPNGDGRHIRSKDGAVDLAVWGIFDVLDEGLDGRWGSLTAAKPGRTIERKERGEGWIRVAGTEEKGGRTLAFVHQVVVSRARDAFAEVEITFPAARKADLAPLVDRIVASLRFVEGAR